MSSMTSDTTYNGWKNYPTWNVHLWLTNDEGLYSYCLEIVRESRKSESKYDVPQRVYLADSLKDLVRETEEDGGLLPDLGASLASDLLGYALDCVDWFEIADAFLED